MTKESQVYYKGSMLARVVCRHDGYYQCRTVHDHAPVGPYWEDAPEAWKWAQDWFEQHGHEVK